MPCILIHTLHAPSVRLLYTSRLGMTINDNKRQTKKSKYPFIKLDIKFIPNKNTNKTGTTQAFESPSKRYTLISILQ